MQLWNLNIRPECERKCKLRDFVLHDRRCEHASLLFSFRSSIRPNPCVLRSENAKLLLTSAWQLRWLTHIINGCRQMNMTPADLFIPFINRARADHWHLISTDFTLALTQLRWFVFLENFQQLIWRSNGKSRRANDQVMIMQFYCAKIYSIRLSNRLAAPYGRIYFQFSQFKELPTANRNFSQSVFLVALATWVTDDALIVSRLVIAIVNI